MTEARGYGEANLAVSRRFRLGLEVATRLAERTSLAREQRIQDAEERGYREASELRQRLTAERSAAEAGLRPTLTDRWWQLADHARIADSWQLACGWQSSSQLANDAARRIGAEVQQRYGIDAAHPGVKQREVEKLFREADMFERMSGSGERLTASQLMAIVDLLDSTAAYEKGRSTSVWA
ncbi:hypothetical protein ABH922_000230 [Rhodococcus sp. 27YEA15]|uniref:hypothetical protein n=1 Tax=Rhodococcus sp. 27YEA15 TaxID=3156259 RepID=UPI003C7D4F5C